MSWSKVNGWPPLGWWYHKIMCEFGWHVRSLIGWKMYYRHLDSMVDKYELNLSGKTFKRR